MKKPQQQDNILEIWKQALAEVSPASGGSQGLTFEELLSRFPGIGARKLRQMLNQAIRAGVVVVSFEPRHNIVGRIYQPPVYSLNRGRK